MVLQTQRLTLVSLNPEQFAQYLLNPAALEIHMGWQPSGQIMSQCTLQALQWRYWLGIEHIEAFHWYTSWQIILSEQSRPIGFACFQGPPAAPDFTVELGYRIHLPFRRQGYMTEAAKKLCQWALAQSDVHTVCAQTEQGNYPSEGVLKNCGMQLCAVQDDMAIWCISNDFGTKRAKQVSK